MSELLTVAIELVLSSAAKEEKYYVTSLGLVVNGYVAIFDCRGNKRGSGRTAPFLPNGSNVARDGPLVVSEVESEAI